MRLAVTASRDEAEESIRCVLRFTGTRKPFTLTEIVLPKGMADDLGLAPPAGFIDQPLPVPDPEEDDAAFVERFNRTTRRWVGQVPLPPDTDVVLTFAARHPLAGSGTIRFQTERRSPDGSGGIVQFGSAEL